MLSITVYAEPWKLTASWLWISFGCLILFVLLVFPAYWTIDKCFDNHKYDSILNKEIEMKGENTETNWNKRKLAQKLSKDARTSELG